MRLRTLGLALALPFVASCGDSPTEPQLPITFSGTIQVRNGTTVPANARVLALWGVAAGSPDYSYVYGTGTVNSNGTFTITFDADLDTEVDESGTVTHTYTYTVFEPGDDTYAVAVSCGANGVLDSQSAGSFGCIFDDGDATSTVSAQATDEDGDAGDGQRHRDRARAARRRASRAPPGGRRPTSARRAAADRSARVRRRAAERVCCASALLEAALRPSRLRTRSLARERRRDVLVLPR